MSVLIKGLDRPKENQRGLWVVIHADGIVEYDSGDEGWKTLKQAAYSVPPHGRLIEADALTRAQGFHDYKYENGLMYVEVGEVVSLIKAAPTIIPAEEEE